MQSYTIAGHVIQISGKGLDSLPGFSIFSSEKPDIKPLLTICTEKKIEDWNFTPCFSSKYEETSYDLSIKDKVFLLRMKQAAGSCLLAEIRSEGNCFRATLNQTGIFNKYSLSFFCWLIFGIAALSRQTVSIHSSTVMIEGKSILFLGESGTGKSTQTGLWLKHIPNTEMLNDDSPFIKVETDGNIRVYGSPWSGKTPCYKNINTEIAAFVRVSQAPFNRVRRLRGIEAIGALQPSCPFAFVYDNKLAESIYSILSNTLLQIPVFHLECLPDKDAAELVYLTLKQDNIL